MAKREPSGWKTCYYHMADEPWVNGKRVWLTGRAIQKHDTQAKAVHLAIWFNDMENKFTNFLATPKRHAVPFQGRIPPKLTQWRIDDDEGT